VIWSIACWVTFSGFFCNFHSHLGEFVRAARTLGQRKNEFSSFRRVIFSQKQAAETFHQDFLISNKKKNAAWTRQQRISLGSV
jgi:hypothetical protein